MTKRFPLVSIVIPTFNSSYFIEGCLSSVFKTNYPNYEVIVVDDCSSDGTVAIIKVKYGKNKKLRILNNRKRKLAAASRNKGFKAAKGDFVALLDHDVEIHPDWISEMVRVMEADSSVGIVQSKIHDINKKDLLQCVGVKIIPQMGWVVVLGHGKKDRGQFDHLKGVVAAATGIMYRMSVFRKVGSFDEKLGINIDDLDLNWRIWIAGFKTVVAPKAITYHWAKKQKTRDFWIRRLNWEFHFSKLPRVFLKNYSAINLVKYLPEYFSISLVRGFFNVVFKFNFAPLIGFLGGTIWSIYELPNTLNQRSFIQRELRKVDDDTLMDKIFVTFPLIKTFKKFWLPLTRNLDLSTRVIEKYK